MATAKHDARKILDGLPEEASLEDIQYHLYVHRPGQTAGVALPPSPQPRGGSFGAASRHRVGETQRAVPGRPTESYAGRVPLDAASARRVYDRVGRWQDTQRFYEDAATARLRRSANLPEARAVFELGCGTGRFAAELLAAELPDSARYLGVDVSPEMVRVASSRLAPWASRAEARLLEPPALTLPGADGSFDRFVATYVFDLLSPANARALIDEAHRMLAPGGLLALVSLTNGTTPRSKLVAGCWGAVARRWPGLVGGCRPIELCDLLEPAPWRVIERDVVTSWGVPSEVVVAAREDRR